MLIHNLPNVMSGCKRLLHAVLQTRKLANGVVAAQKKKEERNKLGCVHSIRNDFTLTKEEEQNDEDNADHFDSWWGGPCNAGAAQVCPHNCFCHSREPSLLSLFRSVGFHNALVSESLLSSVSQSFTSFETLAG